MHFTEEGQLEELGQLEGGDELEESQYEVEEMDRSEESESEHEVEEREHERKDSKGINWVAVCGLGYGYGVRERNAWRIEPLLKRHMNIHHYFTQLPEHCINGSKQPYLVVYGDNTFVSFADCSFGRGTCQTSSLS